MKEKKNKIIRNFWDESIIIKESEEQPAFQEIHENVASNEQIMLVPWKQLEKAVYDFVIVNNFFFLLMGTVLLIHGKSRCTFSSLCCSNYL